LGYISQFDHNTRHIDGTKNEVAGVLTRAFLSTVKLSHEVDLTVMAVKQPQFGCPGVKRSPTTCAGTIICYFLTTSPQSFLPLDASRCVSISSGILPSWDLSATKSHRSKFLLAWHEFDVSPGTSYCRNAQFSDVKRGLAGPLHSCNGYTHLLTCVYQYTHWAKRSSLANVRRTQASSRLVTIFEILLTFTTDRDVRFGSALFQTLLTFLGCTRMQMTAESPAADDTLECFHRQLKTDRPTAEEPANSSGSLPLTLLSIRAALNLDLDRSTAELVFDTAIRLPGEMLVGVGSMTTRRGPRTRSLS
uniref:Reverse transcriptase domain-containing protein n=1 Tax=Schistocephalus solidus TaxID=70667 RepID=A0A183SWH6_SCHSO